MTYYKDTKTGKTYTSPRAGAVEVARPQRATTSNVLSSGKKFKSADQRISGEGFSQIQKDAMIDAVINRQPTKADQRKANSTSHTDFSSDFSPIGMPITLNLSLIHI